MAAAKAMRNPVHPGEIIHADVIEPSGLSISAAAETLGVRRATLSDLCSGRASLSAEMAVKIEEAFGPKAEHLLAMQCAYDVARVKRRTDAALARAKRARSSASARSRRQSNARAAV